MKEEEIKALFPEGVETITITKNDYDRLYGQMTYENIILQQEIDKLNNKLHETSERLNELYNERTDLKNKNNNLNNIINSLEKDLKNKIEEDRLNILSNPHWLYVLDKLKALKENNNVRY